ncbi:unnamed protein product, partial [Staurois parvus]
TLHLAQCSQASTVLATAKPRQDCQTEKRDWSFQRTCPHCSRVQWWRALHHDIRCFALHLVMEGLDAAARPMETHSMKLSTHCCWAHLKVTPKLEVFSY